ncbi:hypothetical protein C8T65DRAFT_656313 [Cerioporus squamosus]|nr:hypothetical protein C8T65DRAFT_656313 [Cerioporus squamosus]
MVLIWTGLSAIIFPPAIVAGAAVASAAVMLYGCGKLLEGIGRGLAYAPELLYRACVGKQVKKVAATWRARRLEVQGQDVEVSIRDQPETSPSHVSSILCEPSLLCMCCGNGSSK